MFGQGQEIDDRFKIDHINRPIIIIKIKVNMEKKDGKFELQQQQQN